MGEAADWYLSPAAVPLDFTRAFYELTGPAALPPRHAFGFMATYWGWETMEFVEGGFLQWNCVRLAALPRAHAARRAPVA